MKNSLMNIELLDVPNYIKSMRLLVQKMVNIVAIISPVITWLLYIAWVCYVFGGRLWLNNQLPQIFINVWLGFVIFIAVLGSILCWHFFRKNLSQWRFLYFFMLLPNLYLCLFVIGGFISRIYPFLHWIGFVTNIPLEIIGSLWFICLLIYTIFCFITVSRS
jgi:hypothetical protein